MKKAQFDTDSNKTPSSPESDLKMPSLSGFFNHLRNRTLGERLLQAANVMPRHVRVHWHGADSPHQGALALARWAQIFAESHGANPWILSVGEDEEFHQRLNQSMQACRVQFRSASLDEALTLPETSLVNLAGIVCGHADTRRITACSRALALHPHLSRVPFEYAAGVNPEKTQFERQDEYRNTWFVSPGMLDSPTPYQIYDESLTRFEQKCGLRDYLDLYQMLVYVVQNQVPGAIAEFGSYKGHSGYLIARTLQALGSDKKIYLFDMFEQFPPEPFGVDHFWNRSHQVNFDEVRNKFSGIGNVTLVKGDFTQTLEASGVGELALAYIDCDSYRATRHLIDRLWDHHLAPRAALVCEDYGHPALLGNRTAVHEKLDARSGCFRFFSQFSGFYIVVKTS